MSLFKIAFLLTLYNNPEQANMFIKQLLEYQGSYIFIHIDQKSLDIKDKIIKHDRVKIMPKSYIVEWGDYTQFISVLELMKYVNAEGNFDYYSLHSGSDLLIKPIHEFVDFLKKDHKYAYTICRKLPDPTWQYGGGLGRIALRWPKFFRKKYSCHHPMRYIRSLYGKAYGAGILRGHKLPDDIEFWGRSDWYTLRGDCVKDIIKYTNKHPEYMELFKDSLIGSEIFFTTLVHMNKSEEIVSDNDLRYIDFKNVDKSTPGSPKLLTTEDYDKIMKSDRFFARKFDIRVDRAVVDRIIGEVSR